MGRLALQVAALIALVEFGRREVISEQTWQSRSVYLQLMVCGLFAAIVGKPEWYDVSYRLLLGSLGGFFAGRMLYLAVQAYQHSPADAADHPSLPILCGLAACVYVSTTCAKIEAPRAAALLVAVAGLWFIQHRMAAAGANLLRQCRGPVAFAGLLLAGGCLLASTAPAVAGEVVVDVTQVAEIEPATADAVSDSPTTDGDDEAAAEKEYLAVEAGSGEVSPLVTGLERIGMAVTPIVALFVLVWFVSRMPFAQ